jgi:hypothetical protein
VTSRILIRVAGAGGEPVREHVIARQMRWTRGEGWEELADNRLLPDQWIALELTLPPEQGGTVDVRVEPDHDYHARVYPALLEMLDLSERERASLGEAGGAAGASGYSLYRQA